MKSIKYQVLGNKYQVSSTDCKVQGKSERVLILNTLYFILLLILCTLYSVFSFGQGGTWTWISGSNQVNSTGVFGTQGVPSINNYPPALYEAVEWKDKTGNFWIYGGYPSYSDLWKFNPLTYEWTWVKGSGLQNQPAVYGTEGVASSANTPGTRELAAASWVDTSGALWLFGGYNNVDYCSDLWKYDIVADQWTWMKGDSTVNSQGVHGTQGVPGSLNTPGARDETASAWIDSFNNLWLFGGLGYDENGAKGYLNDLCKYDIGANEWTWMKGSVLKAAPVSYGTKGMIATGNDPGARVTYSKWKDVQGNFWLMGGMVNNNCLNDCWKYDLSLNEWTWMNGPNVVNDEGNYQSNCKFDTINIPYSRMEQRSSVTDNCGRFWLFGGAVSSDYYHFNDLWVFDPQQLKWNWLSGTNAPNQAGSYGTLGIASPSNMPPSRWGAVAWWGNDNKFYMFGGNQDDVSNSYADVWVFTADTNCITSSCSTVVVTPPAANFQSNKTTLCTNDCINFTDLSTNATAWQWSFAGAVDSTSSAQNPQNVCYSSAGIYNVTLIAFNAGGSDTVTFTNYINVKSSPPTPSVTQEGTMLYCSTDPSYTSYQWYDSTALIPGATDTFLVVSKSGDYNVQVENANGCKIAVGINIIIGVQNYVNDHVVSLSPNPVKDKFTVYGLQFTVARIEIYNVLGQACLQSEITNPKSEIDVSSLPSSIYFVQVKSESARWVGKFVKE